MVKHPYLSPRERCQVEFPEGEPTRTKQSFKTECDINHILAKYQRTGILEHARRYGPEYGYAPAVEFKSAMDIVAKGRSMFEALPSSLRKRFGSPDEFLSFVQDEANVVEARQLGLIPNVVPAEPQAPEGPSAPEGQGDPAGGTASPA